MAKLVDCPSCGGFVPAGQRCCPHCHCRYSRWRRFVLIVSAALGAAGCAPTNVQHYGASPGTQPPAVDASIPDMAVSDLSHGQD